MACLIKRNVHTTNRSIDQTTIVEVQQHPPSSPSNPLIIFRAGARPTRSSQQSAVRLTFSHQLCFPAAQLKFSWGSCRSAQSFVEILNRPEPQCFLVLLAENFLVSTYQLAYKHPLQVLSWQNQLPVVALSLEGPARNVIERKYDVIGVVQPVGYAHELRSSAIFRSAEELAEPR